MISVLKRRDLLIAVLCLSTAPVAPMAAIARERPELKMFVGSVDLPLSGLDEKGHYIGMIETALELINAELGWKITYASVPWRRAQEYMRQGGLDAYCTVPTRERREYVHFSAEPLFTLDASWAYFSADNPRADELRKISTLEQLKSFRIGLERGDSWPNALMTDGWDTTEVETVALLESMALAHRIDLFFETPEIVKFQQRASGKAPLASIRLDLLSGGITPYGFGLRRSFPNADRLMVEFDAAHQRVRASGALDKALAIFRT